MENGTQPSVKLAVDQAVVVFYYDLAIHMLLGMQNQLKLFKQESPARQFGRMMDTLAEKRNGYIQEVQGRVQVVQKALSE